MQKLKVSKCMVIIKSPEFIMLLTLLSKAGVLSIINHIDCVDFNRLKYHYHTVSHRAAL